MEDEQSANDGGPITDILRNAGSFASSLENVPFISSYAGMCKWAANISS